MARRVVRGGLIAAAIVALSVALASVRLGGNAPATWATVSAVLAVIAAVISAWTSQRVVELQEDALEPNLVPSIDLRSRYNLAQFRIANRGGSPAFDIRIEWERPLKDARGADVTLGTKSPIPVLSPGENASVLLGASHTFMQSVPDTSCRGTISFVDASGRRRSTSFVVSGEHERSSLVHDAETTKAEHEIQKLPAALESIAREVSMLRDVIESGMRR